MREYDGLVLVILFSFVISIVINGIPDVFDCGPSESCTCVRKQWPELVSMDCSDRNITLMAVCNYTRTNQDITEVILNSNNVPTIGRRDVEGCEHLVKLDLRKVRLNRIDKNAFLGLKHLMYLDLSENELDIYSSKGQTQVGSITKITSLRELRIQGNLKTGSVTNVTYPTFSNLSRLETLFMDGLPNAEFPEDYASLHNLTSLSLSGLHGGVCLLGELDNATFDATPHLKQLDLSNCSITNIHAGTFKGLHNLTTLDISVNEQLGFNSMRNISYGLQFTKIDLLNVSKVHPTFSLGKMVTIKDMCYLRNTSLRELVLDSNRIELFETNLALILPVTLKVIHVRDNMFTFGPYLLQLACLWNLEIIYAGFQNFAHAPRLYINEPVSSDSFVAPPCGHCIYEAAEYLYNLSRTISGCKYFETNEIEENDLYRGAFPKALKTIFFHDCGMNFKILQFPILPFQNHVEHMDFSGNILYEWIGPIGPFPALKSVNLSRNYCSYIGPDFFMYMSSLLNLQVEKNFIGIPLASDTTGAIFKPLHNLEMLDLSSNQIRDLPPKVFVHLINLRMLNISFNNINEWTIDLQTLQNLEYIDIQSNALSDLPLNVMSHFDKIQSGQDNTFSIDMRNNPIKCSCKYERFLTWMVKHRSSFIGFDHYNFTDDSGSHLTTSAFVKQVNNFTKSCRSYTVVIILCTVGVTLFISLIICGLVYKNRWKLRYFLFMNKRRFYGYRAIPDYEPIENFRYDAFISYAEENIRFILDGIIPNVEEKGIQLCIHQRDFLVGRAINDNIIDAIQSSKKTVVILTRAFLKSKWCIYEFQMARMESIYSRDGNSSVVVVMLEDVPPNKLMPLEMIEWIKQESYIEYTDDEQGNVLFWENLRRAIA